MRLPMSQTVEIPDDLFAQASELAAAAGLEPAAYIVQALREQVSWKRYSITQADKEQRRFAGVQERMPDTDLELE